MSIIGDAHDIHCGCEVPFAHFLDSIFPKGHQDRNKTIEEIVSRDIQQCPSGGLEEENHGLELGDSAETVFTKRERDQDIEEEADTLLAAAAAAAEEEDTR